MSERWMPGHGELYFFITNSGNVCPDHFSSYGTCSNARLDFNNYFKTESEAKAAAEKVKALLLSLHDNDENLQDNIQDMVTNTCKALDKGKENVAKATCTFGNLPKLTAEVFNSPDCPEWAKWAAVDGNGYAHYYSERPFILSDKFGWGIVCGENSRSELIPGKFTHINWSESRIERPAKLPEWCKVGEWVWAIALNAYFKVDKVDGLFISGTDFCGSDYCVAIENVLQARPRPYNAEEMKALVGRPVDSDNGARYLVTKFYDTCGGEVCIDGIYYGADRLLAKFTTNNKPTGVLEHLENGEWVN